MSPFLRIAAPGLGLACAMTIPAAADAGFDGRRSVAATVDEGGCTGPYSYPIVIRDGIVDDAGGSKVDASGRVADDGRIVGSIRSGLASIASRAALRHPPVRDAGPSPVPSPAWAAGPRGSRADVISRAWPWQPTDTGVEKNCVFHSTVKFYVTICNISLQILRQPFVEIWCFEAIATEYMRMRLKHAGAAVLTLGTIAATAGAAEARDGCGPGGHRGYYGYCRPNVVYRPIVVRPVVYGYRRVGCYGPRWHRWGGYRHVGYHRPWGWHGSYRHVGWHHRW